MLHQGYISGTGIDEFGLIKRPYAEQTLLLRNRRSQVRILSGALGSLCTSVCTFGPPIMALGSRLPSQVEQSVLLLSGGGGVHPTSYSRGFDPGCPEDSRETARTSALLGCLAGRKAQAQLRPRPNLMAMADAGHLKLDPVGQELLEEAQSLAAEAQIELCRALLHGLLENRQFFDQAEAELTLGLDYCQQVLSDLQLSR